MIAVRACALALVATAQRTAALSTDPLAARPSWAQKLSDAATSSATSSEAMVDPDIPAVPTAAERYARSYWPPMSPITSIFPIADAGAPLTAKSTPPATHVASRATSPSSAQSALAAFEKDLRKVKVRSLCLSTFFLFGRTCYSFQNFVFGRACLWIRSKC